MGYFEQLAEQAFKTAPDGRQLFYRGGPWSRPYIVPDGDSRQRLLERQTWMMRVLMGGIIFGQPILFLRLPGVTSKPLWFLGYATIVMLVYWIVGYRLFYDEVAQLSRLESRLSLRAYFVGVAEKHTKDELLQLALGALGFVVVGFLLLALKSNPVVAWLCISFFGIAAIANLYALSVKPGPQRPGGER